MSERKRTRTFIVKPASLNCNQKCAYCYNGIEHLSRSNLPLMTLETIRVFIDSLTSLRETNIKIIWHGGEPLLAGKDFYTEVQKIQQNFIKENPNIQITSSVMTNATLIDDEWGQFFKANKWQVCISLDGPPEVHNKFRVDAQGRGTHEKVIRGIETVRNYGIDPSFLTVVSSETIKYSPKVIHDYLSAVCRNFDYIACWEMPFENKIPEYVITPEEFLKFILTAFDYWWEKDDPTISVRLFKSLVQGVLGGYPRTCSFQGTCSQFTAINSDGSVYPCGKYSGLPEFYLGNIHEDNLGAILDSTAHHDYLSTARAKPQNCLMCRWFTACHNGCTYERYLGNNTFQSESPFCETWKLAYEHVERKVAQTKQLLAN